MTSGTESPKQSADTSERRSTTVTPKKGRHCTGDFGRAQVRGNEWHARLEASELRLEAARRRLEESRREPTTAPLVVQAPSRFTPSGATSSTSSGVSGEVGVKPEETKEGAEKKCETDEIPPGKKNIQGVRR